MADLTRHDSTCIRVLGCGCADDVSDSQTGKKNEEEEEERVSRADEGQ